MNRPRVAAALLLSVAIVPVAAAGESTPPAFHGEPSAWEDLARLYPYQIDHYQGDARDRVRGYAWAYLHALAYEKNSVYGRLAREAWGRLDGPQEQAEAEALARRYEEELYPLRIRDRSPAGICRLAPQFLSEGTADRSVNQPVGPPPDPTDYPRFVFARIPEAQWGAAVVSGPAEAGAEPVTVGWMPAGRSGWLARAYCTIPEAAIFAESGEVYAAALDADREAAVVLLGQSPRLLVEVHLERPGGESVRVCRGYRWFPGHISHSRGESSAHRIAGGERITARCRAVGGSGRLGPGADACTVEVRLWIRDETAGPG